MANGYTELIVWQLAAELRIETLKLTRKPAYARDPRLRGETEATVSSICRNIPEGFRRRSNREFARFLEYSYASSGELKSLFEDAQLKSHVTADELAAARALKVSPGSGVDRPDATFAQDKDRDT
jgi:four helix bundle protein